MLTILSNCLFLLLLSSILLVDASVRLISTNETFTSQAAAFGPKVDKFGLLAHVYVPLQNKYGCVPVDAPPPTQWIALVERGQCSFYHKVQMMQQSGAIAVIVGDPTITHYVTMSSQEDTTNVRIPGLFLTRTAYQKLAQQQPTLVLLEHDDKVPWSGMDWFYILVTVCPLVLFTLGWTVVRFTAPLLSAHPTVTDLERYLPRQHYTPLNDECPICLDVFDQQGDYRVLPCHHTFHTSCIDPWLTQYRSSCPICSKEPFPHL
ncbi:hypothetical protein [Absidia glauca]|uniref:RING-type domain-containing protein n=1 Tax=Absidia glauca TaxID=4829 RepID=A0A168M5J6_ABSGL|nr:hypothetical protein [Absidia glauca]